MVAQKKKPKNRERVKNPEKFNWTTQRRKAAQMLSTGLYSQNQVAETLHVYPQTVSSWKQYPEFIQEVDRLTFLQENATRAGVVRLALKALGIKENTIEEDRSTYLDYLEFILKTIPPDVKGDEDKLKELADAITNSAKLIGK
jgi:predicted transcriptional regulator